MTSIDEARDQARDAATGSAGDRLLERLAELVGGKASVEAVFGEPIRQGDLTIVHVARVRWGFGGGAGQSNAGPTGASAGTDEFVGPGESHRRRNRDRPRRTP